jgi:hypothetical protein
MANGLGGGVIPGPFAHSQVAHQTYMLSQPSLHPSRISLTDACQRGRTEPLP